MMDLPKLFFSLVFLFAILAEPICSARLPAPARKRPRGDFGNEYMHGQNIGDVRASSGLQKILKDSFQAERLFVFGASYVDTGNRHFTSPSWKKPYGKTWPKHPFGRFSDGRVFTDYFGDALGLHPLPYRDINPGNRAELRDGANFAFGGAGVLESGSDYPNLFTQIGYLKGYLDHGYLKKTDLENSLSLFSVNGNDYAAYLARGDPIDRLPDFIENVVSRLVNATESLCDLGAKKVAVAAIPPQNCIPLLALSPNECNETLRDYFRLHNGIQEAATFYLNIAGRCTYHILDFYSAFEKVFHSGSFPNPYHACCVGISSNYACGDVDENGEPMYTVCDDPNSTFYWDLKNPTQAGWKAVSEIVLEDPSEQINHSFMQ